MAGTDATQKDNDLGSTTSLMRCEKKNGWAIWIMAAQRQFRFHYSTILIGFASEVVGYR